MREEEECDVGEWVKLSRRAKMRHEQRIENMYLGIFLLARTTVHLL
jgi:hypothetical protein